MFIRSGTEMRVAKWNLSNCPHGLSILVQTDMLVDGFFCRQALLYLSSMGCKTSQLEARVLIASGEW